MKMRKATIGALCALMIVGAARADTMTAIQDGADRVVAVQHTDGKWGWPITAPPTYTNITGPTGMGLVTAYGHTADASHLTAAQDAGDSLVGLTSDWVGTYNPMFLLALHDATGDASYQAQAQSFFTDLQAGTYTRQSVDYDTAGWISLIQTARSGSLVNMRPWEFAPQAYAASMAGNAAQEAAFVQAIKDGIETLDSSSPGTVGIDLLGLAGGVMGLSWLGVDFDPTAGSFASAGSTADLANLLAGYQNANGSWYEHSSLVSPTTDNEDLQTTAYALLALLAANDFGQFNGEIMLGRQYLVDAQLANGGWPSYGVAGQEYAEIDGEVLWALSETADVVPEPATMLLLGGALVGGIGYRRRRRRA